jgi:hypothetical protein
MNIEQRIEELHQLIAERDEINNRIAGLFGVSEVTVASPKHKSTKAAKKATGKGCPDCGSLRRHRSGCSRNNKPAQPKKPAEDEKQEVEPLT